MGNEASTEELQGGGTNNVGSAERNGIYLNLSLKKKDNHNHHAAGQQRENQGGGNHNHKLMNQASQSSYSAGASAERQTSQQQTTMLQESSPQDPLKNSQLQQQQQHSSRFSFNNNHHNHPSTTPSTQGNGNSSSASSSATTTTTNNAKKFKAFIKQKAQQFSDKAALVQQSQNDFHSATSPIHAPFGFSKKQQGSSSSSNPNSVSAIVPTQRRMKEKLRKANAKHRGGTAGAVIGDTAAAGTVGSPYQRQQQQQQQQQQQPLQQTYIPSRGTPHSQQYHPGSAGGGGHCGTNSSTSRIVPTVYSPQEQQQNWMAQQHYQHQQQQQQQQQQHYNQQQQQYNQQYNQQQQYNHHHHQQQQQQHSNHVSHSSSHSQHPRGGVPKSPKTQTVMNVMYHSTQTNYPSSPRRSNGTGISSTGSPSMQLVSQHMGNMSFNDYGASTGTRTYTHPPSPLVDPMHPNSSTAVDARVNNAGMSIGTSTTMRKVNEEEHWQHAWEEDEGGDSGSDEEEEDANDSNRADSQSSVIGGLHVVVPPNRSQPSSTTPTGAHIDHFHGGGGIRTASSQLLRSTLDTGHASSSVMDSPSRQYQPTPPISPLPLQSNTTFSTNNTLRIGPHRISGDPNLVASRVDTALEGGASGVNWDTAVSPSDRYEKPNIIMFLPLLRVLGKGSFGKVVLVQKRFGYEKGKLFAMKILKKSHLLRRGQIDRTRTERKVLSVVDHPFIMKLHFAFQSDDKLFLVLDYCSGGELFFHLTRYRKFSEPMAQFYAAELLLALGHLHSKGIIYRDLKPENVLFDSEGHVKLGDFGLAKNDIRHPYKGATSVCGTPEYMAPEILMQMGHGFCVDYWGLGMLIFEMMTGLPPWYTTDQQLMMRRLKSAPLEIPAFFSPQSRSCVYSLLQRDPRRRLGVRGPQTVADHTFFRSLDFRSILKRHVNAPIRPCGGWKATLETSKAESVSPSPTARKKEPTSTNEKELHAQDIDAATANFSDEFTRMAVNSMSEDQEDPRIAFDHSEDEELNENTFIGFTFDEQESKQ